MEQKQNEVPQLRMKVCVKRGKHLQKLDDDTNHQSSNKVEYKSVNIYHPNNKIEILSVHFPKVNILTYPHLVKIRYVKNLI